MFQTLSIVNVYFALSLGIVSAQEATAPPLPPNAALQYWQAFSFLSDDKAGNQELMNLGGHAPAGEWRRGFVGSMETPLKYLHRGALVRQCDWGIDVKADGPDTLLPHLGKARNLAKIGCLAAAEAFDAKDYELGVTRILDVLALGRHSGSEGLLIAKLVGVAIENMGMTTLAEHLSQLPKPMLEKLTARLDALPPDATMASCIRGEAEMLEYMERKAGMVGKAASLAKSLVEVFTTDGKKNDLNTELLQHPEKFMSFYADGREYYKELESIIELPYAQFIPAEAALRKKHSGNVLTQAIIPAFNGIRATSEAEACQRLLLRAGIQLVLQDKKDAAKTVDPYASANTPFEYKALPDGFELSSAFKRKDERVSLRFAPPHEKPEEPVKPPRPPKAEQVGDF